MLTALPFFGTYRTVTVTRTLPLRCTALCVAFVSLATIDALVAVLIVRLALVTPLPLIVSLPAPSPLIFAVIDFDEALILLTFGLHPLNLAATPLCDEITVLTRELRCRPSCRDRRRSACPTPRGCRACRR